MPVLSETEIQIKLRGLLDKLSPNQAEYLRVRQLCDSDAEAAKKVGIATTTVSRWKKNADFMTAYTITTQMLGAKRELVVADQNKQAIVKAQMATLMHTLPNIVQKLMDIALNGKSEEMKVRATKLIFDTVGLGPQAELPLNKQTKSFLSVAELLAPQAQHELIKRGAPEDKDLETLVREGATLGMEAVDTQAVAEELVNEEEEL